MLYLNTNEQVLQIVDNFFDSDLSAALEMTCFFSSDLSHHIFQIIFLQYISTKFTKHVDIIYPSFQATFNEYTKPDA